MKKPASLNYYFFSFCFFFFVILLCFKHFILRLNEFVAFCFAFWFDTKSCWNHLELVCDKSLLIILFNIVSCLLENVVKFFVWCNPLVKMHGISIITNFSNDLNYSDEFYVLQSGLAPEKDVPNCQENRAKRCVTVDKCIILL